MRERIRVGLVGAGGISEIHARLLRAMEGVEVAAVVDRDLERAGRLAEETGAAGVHADVEALLAAGGVDAAHVLVPPDLHAVVAAPLLSAGVHVLCEKPLAPSVAECVRLRDAARSGGARLAVNHNMLFDPVHLRLRGLVESGALGPLRHVSFDWSTPLGPLASGRFGPWMFREPANIVFEQGVHPLSLVQSLGGASDVVETVTSPRRALTESLSFVDEWLITLRLARCTAQVRLAFGRPMKVAALTATCDDGVARADYLNGRLQVERRRPSDLAPGVRDGFAQALSLARQSLARGTDAVLKPLRLRPDPDPFTVSMRGSLARFYDALRARGRAEEDDAELGIELVRTCEAIVRDVAPNPPREAPPAPRPVPATCDVAVIGGTGVIGRALVRELVGAGHEVRVMARGVSALGPVYAHERVHVVRGSAESDEDVAAFVAGARFVVDLFYVTEGAGADRRMVASAERIARAAKAAGVERLVYTSSTAALYLGDPGEVVTGSTPADPRSAERSAYTHGKAESERRLAELRRDEGVPVCVLRPGIVVGEGAVALHPGIGRVLDEQHCVGWGAGTNPMAFVLVEDVARAIRLALEADGVEGKTYNVVGAAPVSGREYVAALGEALGRPLVYHPCSLLGFQASEVAKWVLKRLAGRRDAAFPSLRDARSRAMYARFDLANERRELGWEPEADRAAFLRRAVGVHADSA